MKKTNSVKDFFMCFLTNLMLHFEWGVCTVIFLVLFLWMDLSWLFMTASFLVWVIQSAVLAGLALWGNQCSAEPTPPRPNKNPYSAKTSDIAELKDGKIKGTSPKTGYREVSEILRVMGVGKDEIKDLMKALWNGQKVEADGFLKVLSKEGYLCHLSENQPYPETAGGLSAAAAKTGMKSLPSELMGNASDAMGLAAAAHITKHFDGWRIFVILGAFGGYYEDGFYAGVVEQEKAEKLVGMMDDFFSEKFSVVLLGKS